MPRYKPYSYAQGKFIPVHFASQILPGTFEFTLNHLIDHELDLSLFDERFKNDGCQYRSKSVPVSAK
ncbi:hypothetical protein ACUUL3_01855 [Thiovibrio sp. JS02]